ncbi:MAG: hypothetical protein ACREJ3_16885, partial [Polyangiaceae bacterium]
MFAFYTPRDEDVIARVRERRKKEKAVMKLNREWGALMTAYERDHADPRNQACHSIGIPLIAASFPVGATVVGLPLAAGMFTTG